MKDAATGCVILSRPHPLSAVKGLRAGKNAWGQVKRGIESVAKNGRILV
jgi:hypothetical protein